MEKKTRPDSRQKKGGPEAEEGGASTETGKKGGPSQKWTMALSSSRIKSAKLSKANLSTENSKGSEVDKQKSFLGLDGEGSGVDRKKSAILRKKSASKLGDIGRAVAMRKLIGKKSYRSSNEDEEETPKDVKIWDEKLESLALKNKRVSVIDKEIGLRYIRVIPSTPLIRTVAVKKKCTPVQDVHVIRKASPTAEVKEIRHMGARYDALGKIIPHSILGDVDSFLCHSRQRNRESNILLVHTAKTPRTKDNMEKDCVVNNPYLNEENALKTWQGEMERRKQQQSRLAGILKCKEESLLMCKSVGHRQVEKQMMLNHLHYHDYRHNPDVCFWKVGDKVTAGHLQDTLTETAKGHLPSTVVLGDADHIIREKGKKCKPDIDVCKPDVDVCKSDIDVCKKEDYMYLQQKYFNMQGTIHIDNKVLFSELVLLGKGVLSQRQDVHTERSNASGDDRREVKAVKFHTSEDNGTDNPSTWNLLDTAGGRTQRSTSPHMKSPAGYDPTKRRGTVYQDLIMADHISRLSKNNRGIFDFKFIRQEIKELEGPAMMIDGAVFQWCCNGSDIDCDCNSKAIKKFFVLIKGESREVSRGFAKLVNTGTTMIRYSWKKVPEYRPLPVPRPHRRCFYFLDDDGIVLPRETVYVPMLFRSTGPGYFSESWILKTQPILEGGAPIKFTFKGIATHVQDFSREIQDIEVYLERKQVQTLCSEEAKTLLDYAVVKASLEDGRIREDPVVKSSEEMFRETNPGLHYHNHVIDRLQMLCESFIPVKKQQKLEDGTLLVSVPDLWKAFLALPDDDSDDETYDDSYTNLTQKQTLLWQLSTDISILCFTPLLAWQPSFKFKQFLLISLLQSGVDSVIKFAHTLATNLGLEMKEQDSVQKQEKENKNKTKVSTKPSKALTRSLLPVSPEQQRDARVFSTAYRYRMKNTDKYNPLLAQYDEKVYIKVYSMLEETVEKMSVLFEVL